MLKKRMEEELNKQINAEFFSSYLYLSMSCYFANKNLDGFANWMDIQAKEEWGHGMKMLNYLKDRGGVVKLEKIDTPENEWKGIIDVFKETLAHENKVTGLINNLMDVAIEEKDHAMKSFLQWFVDEQVEEEATAENLIIQLEMIDGKGPGLFMIDRELKQRVYVPIPQKQA